MVLDLSCTLFSATLFLLAEILFTIKSNISKTEMSLFHIETSFVIEVSFLNSFLI